MEVGNVAFVKKLGKDAAAVKACNENFGPKTYTLENKELQSEILLSNSPAGKISVQS